jgi:hypothetical protein
MIQPWLRFEKKISSLEVSLSFLLARYQHELVF